jgi:hypothetical protein
MLTPWVKPVTAGKKMANTTQKPRAPSGEESPSLTRSPAAPSSAPR